MRPLLDDTNEAQCRLRIPSVLLSRVSPDPEIREAARHAQERIADAESRNRSRSDIACLVAAVFEKEKDSTELDDEDRYVLAHVQGQFSRSGAAIDDEAKKSRLDELRSEISQINTEAIMSFTEADDGMWLTQSELAGCPETWLATLRTEIRRRRTSLVLGSVSQ